MCNLYSMTRNRDAISRLFRVSHNRIPAIDPLKQIFPGLDGARHPQGSGRRARDLAAHLGLRAAAGWPRSEARDEHGRKPATWHWFGLKGDEPRPLFAFAGLWRRWRGPVKKDGPNVDIDVYSFMTTLLNALTVTINHERMPVLLTEEHEFESWLSRTPKEALSLAKG